jgi:hypothetical protein
MSHRKHRISGAVQIPSRKEIDARNFEKFKKAWNIPPCAEAMGCLCAGHARGNAADAPCDMSET